MTLFLILAIILALISLLMLPPLAVAFFQGEYFMLRAFLVAPAIGLILALLALLLMPRKPLSLRIKDGFLLVFLIWVLASFAGSIPYFLSPLNISLYDSIFESACGFSTTGATTFQDIEVLPRSLLLWRSMSHWAGGIGIILLSVALMPLLGVGGFQLIKAETPGPEKQKITPRVTETAKIIWGVYIAFTVILALLYRFGGMEWFDAVCHSFSVMATGGVSTKNSGFGFYNSPFIDWVTVIFMLLGALNFNIYYRVVHGKFRDLVQNTECKVYFFIFAAAAFVISLSLIPSCGSFGDALRFGSFQAASILSSTGNARTDYMAWPSLAQGVLFCLMFIGGCSGSTAGGVKVIRVTILFEQAGNELRRILFPRGVFSIRLNKKVGRKDVVYGTAGFVFLYFVIVGITTLVTASAGFDIFSSFSAALSVVGNIGTGFGAIRPYHSYSIFPNHLKLFYSLVMIAGRLELWTVFVLFTPEYWKR
jgi:trk system potassium uptake protein TrkH